MRVLIIFNHPAPYKVHSFNELAKYVDLTVLFERTKERNRLDEFYAANDYRFEHIVLKDGYVFDDGSISNGVKKYIKEHHQDFDIILMNGYSHLAEIKAINYMHRHHIKFGLLINGGIIKKESFLKKAYKKSLISKADYYLSPCEEANKYLRYYGAVNPIYKYIYSNLFAKEILKDTNIDKTEIRNKLGLPLNKKIFINSSQFIDRKNNIQLINIFKNRDEELLLIGDGKENKNYHELIEKEGIKNITILPFKKKDELFEYFKASDCFITLSKEDIYGHTTIEALANALPVISSNKVISSVEYVKNGYNGYVVDINNEQEIIEAINSIDKIDRNNTVKSAKDLNFEESAKSIYKILGDIYAK